MTKLQLTIHATQLKNVAGIGTLLADNLERCIEIHYVVYCSILLYTLITNLSYYKFISFSFTPQAKVNLIRLLLLHC